MSIQMTCPYCKKEFPFDNGKLDKEIEMSKQKIAKVNEELVQIKALPKSLRKMREGRRKVLVLEQHREQSRVTELKSIRKASDQQIKYYEYQEFKNIVKELYGEEAYKKIIELVDENIKAYKLSGLMRHEYTRSQNKCAVTSTNKL